MRVMYLIAVVLGLGIMFAMVDKAALAQSNSQDPRIEVLDNCDPADPGYNPTGGCLLKPHLGDVTVAEFGLLLFSPLAANIIGHPSWRNEPSYISVRAGQKIQVTNRGGRGHTFTEVVAYGGGFVPPLNGVGGPAIPLVPAAACVPPPGTQILAPGDSTNLTGLAPGLHRFQCCIHPWMRAAIRVN